MSATTTTSGATNRPLRIDPPGDAAPDAAEYSGGNVPPAEWFERVYVGAAGQCDAVPWGRGVPNPLVINWLNAEAPGLVRPGARTIVVGCGLGDDVAELACRGYDVLGFDCSPTAIEWARRRFPDLSSAFVTADLFDLPARFRARFDFVVEANTLQSLPPVRRQDAARAIGSLGTQRGITLAIARGRDDSQLLSDVQGPPWPLSVGELTSLMELSGLRPIRPVADFLDDARPPIRRIRAAFSR